VKQTKEERLAEWICGALRALSKGKSLPHWVSSEGLVKQLGWSDESLLEIGVLHGVNEGWMEKSTDGLVAMTHEGLLRAVRR
jgi:hypothetical protein